MEVSAVVETTATVAELPETLTRVAPAPEDTAAFVANVAAVRAKPLELFIIDFSPIYVSLYCHNTGQAKGLRLQQPKSIELLQLETYLETSSCITGKNTASNSRCLLKATGLNYLKRLKKSKIPSIRSVHESSSLFASK